MKKTPISISRYLGTNVTQKFTKCIQINVIKRTSSRDFSKHLVYNRAWNNSVLNVKDTHDEKTLSGGAAPVLYGPHFTNEWGKCSYISQSVFNKVRTAKEGRFSNVGLTSAATCRMFSSTSIRSSSCVNQMVVESQNLSESTNLVTQLNETPTSTAVNSAANILSDVHTNVVPSTSNLETVTSSIEPAFTSLGLAHGWPSGWMQALLESLHINMDLSWSGTIILTTLIMRLLIFPIMLRGRIVMVKMNHNLPEMQKHQYEMHIAKTKQEAIQAMNKLKKFQKEKGINPSAQFAPMACSGMVMATMFFALRGMTYYPVESMKVGGMGWFLDLTTKDPYFILPILTAATLALNMKLGMDATDQSQTPEPIKKFMKVIPVVTLAATCTFPSALCLYWFVSNVISLSQGALLRIPAVKNATGVEEFKTWDDADLPMKNINFFQEVAKTQALHEMPDSSTNTQNFDKMGIDEALRKAELRKKAKEN